MDAARRRLLLAGAGLYGLSLAPAMARAAESLKLPTDPFTLGVASGEPDAGGFVIWTRLAPEPLDGGGMPAEAVPVQWEVAEDEGFARGLRRGTAMAEAAWAHSVHVQVEGLKPARDYWYRFSAAGHRSGSGRARTLPAAAAAPARFDLAFASCQHYEMGYYAAYRHMAADAPDLVLHLGDYIYESSMREGAVRAHGNPQPEDLAQYRNRYARYKLDADLQAAHAASPWMTTWDDHEVDNDYAGAHASYNGSPEAFMRRRAAAYQAYWEHLPLRPSMRPRDAHLPLYRGVRVGNLLDIAVLDSRQYRDDQACATPKELGGRLLGAECDRARLEPSRSLLGAAQERWLYERFGQGHAQWNLIAQQLLMAQLDQKPGEGQAWWSDGWEGYPMARQRLIEQMVQQRLRNPVVIGGDIHSFWANDIKRDFNDPRSATVATEFVGGSISSRGVPYREFSAMLPDNPHVRFFESRKRGYARCSLTAKAWQTDFVVVDDAADAASPARVLTRFAVEAGRPGVQPA